MNEEGNIINEEHLYVLNDDFIDIREMNIKLFISGLQYQKYYTLGRPGEPQCRTSVQSMTWPLESRTLQAWCHQKPSQVIEPFEDYQYRKRDYNNFESIFWNIFSRLYMLQRSNLLNIVALELIDWFNCINFCSNKHTYRELALRVFIYNFVIRIEKYSWGTL